MDLAGLLPSFGTLTWTIAAFVVALSIIVAVHEYGHYIVGRWTGIKADIFSVGFGPVIYSKIDRHGTRWQIAALPFGGFVKFRGDENAASAKDVEAMSGLSEDELRATMHGAPLWARTLTVLAGPVFNFILSFIVFALLLFARGVASDPITIETLRSLPVETQELEPGDVLLATDGKDVPSLEDFSEFTENLVAQEVIEYTVRRDGTERVVLGPWLFPPVAISVSPGSAAEGAGLQVDDVVVAVDDVAIFQFDQLREIVRASNGNSLKLDVWRGGEVLKFTMTPRRMDLPLQDGGFETHFIIGMGGGMLFDPATENPSLIEAINYGAEQIVFITRSSISGLYHMIAGKISTCNISGPIGIAETSGQAAAQGWISFIWFIIYNFI